MRFTHRSRWAAVAAAALPLAAIASSHREAPFITEHPKVDGTDFYMFRSYEPGRAAFVTLIANYLPLQDSYGGPNYFTLDPDAVYDIHLDNDGDAREDLTFRFRFKNEIQDLSLAIGPAGNQRTVPVPLITTVPGGIGPGVLDRNGLNVIETYTVEIIRGDRRNQGRLLANAAGGMEPTVFTKPVDNVGNKSIPDYAAYAANHVYAVTIPGCQPGKVFVGQRKEPFAVNLGEVFDLVNTNAVGPPNGERNIIDDKNVTSLILEVPVSCLTSGSDPVIGGWTTASLPQVKVLNPAPRFDAARGRTQRVRRRRRVDAGVAARQPARQRGRHRSARQGSIQREPAGARSAVLELRDESGAARVARGVVRRARRACAEQLSAERSRRRVPDGHSGPDEARDVVGAGRDAAAQHGYRGDGGRHAVEPRRARRRYGRFPERPATRRRRRRHRAARGDGRALHAQRSCDVRLRPCRCSDGQLAVHGRRHGRCERLRRGVSVSQAPLAGSPSN